MERSESRTISLFNVIISGKASFLYHNAYVKQNIFVMTSFLHLSETWEGSGYRQTPVWGSIICDNKHVLQKNFCSFSQPLKMVKGTQIPCPATLLMPGLCFSQ